MRKKIKMEERSTTWVWYLLWEKKKKNSPLELIIWLRQESLKFQSKKNKLLTPHPTVHKLNLSGNLDDNILPSRRYDISPLGFDFQLKILQFFATKAIPILKLWNPQSPKWRNTNSENILEFFFSSKNNGVS